MAVNMDIGSDDRKSYNIFEKKILWRTCEQFKRMEYFIVNKIVDCNILGKLDVTDVIRPSIIRWIRHKRGIFYARTLAGAAKYRLVR